MLRAFSSAWHPPLRLSASSRQHTSAATPVREYLRNQAPLVTHFFLPSWPPCFPVLLCVSRAQDWREE